MIAVAVAGQICATQSVVGQGLIGPLPFFGLPIAMGRSRGGGGRTEPGVLPSDGKFLEVAAVTNVSAIAVAEFQGLVRGDGNGGSEADA